VVIGFAIAFWLALLAHRRRRFETPITVTTGVLYTIPSLALFQLLVPFTHLTRLTAEIALVSYTLLIIFRNTLAGLRAVPEDVRESARGMGLTPNQLLWRVELRLALVARVRQAVLERRGRAGVAHRRADEAALEAQLAAGRLQDEVDVELGLDLPAARRVGQVLEVMLEIAGQRAVEPGGQVVARLDAQRRRPPRDDHEHVRADDRALALRTGDRADRAGSCGAAELHTQDIVMPPEGLSGGYRG